MVNHGQHRNSTLCKACYKDCISYESTKVPLLVNQGQPIGSTDWLANKTNQHIWMLLDNNTRVWTMNEGKIPCLGQRGSGNSQEML